MIAPWPELGLPFIIERPALTPKPAKIASAGRRGYDQIVQPGRTWLPASGALWRRPIMVTVTAKSGMDRTFHSDWEPLTRIYRERAQTLAQVDPNWQPPQEKIHRWIHSLLALATARLSLPRNGSMCASRPAM